MGWLRFWQRRQCDDDLARELESYIEHEAAEQVAAGTPPAEARPAARRKLGNMTRIREDAYERNTLPLLETIVKDLEYGWRLLRRSPAFTTIAVMSIAFGIGTNTSVFTLLDRVMLRSLPVPHPEQLVLLTSAGFQYGGADGEGDELSYPMYEDLRDANQPFTSMFARVATVLDLTAASGTDRLNAELVSATYFSTLGIVPARGRVFDANDDRMGATQPVVVLSHRYWRDRLGSDGDVVGRSIIVNSRSMTVVGVAQEGFAGTNVVTASDMFLPLGALDQYGQRLRDRRMRWLNVFGRLKTGITAEQAQTMLQPLYRSRLAAEVREPAFVRASSGDRERFLRGTVDVTPAAYGKSQTRAQLTFPLLTLTAIGVAVLIIACANVANLLLARATGRRREMAVRLAVGATRGRLLRQLLVESVLLALVGGAAGLVLAILGAQGLLAFLAERDTALTLSAWPDGRILAANAIASIVSGVLFGLAPAWQSVRQDASPALKTDSSTLAGSGHARLRRGLVVTQVMLSLLLLVAAGLFVQSVCNLLATPTGFDAQRLLAFKVAPAGHGYDPARTKQFARELLERVRTLPGVTSAGFVSHGLLEGGGWINRMTVEGRPYNQNEPVITQNNRISPEVFATMGIHLVAGRDFDARDELNGDANTPPRVAIANEEFVRRFLGERHPLGVRVGFGRDPGTPTPTEIIGVVTNTKYANLRSPDRPQLYFPYFQEQGIGWFTMYVRATQDPAALGESMQRLVRQIDPTLPIYDVRTVEEQINRSLVLDRMIARLSAVLAMLATLLAMVGLYGVVSYTVSRRGREIAIRQVFGAGGSRITALVVKDMLMLVGGGVLLAAPAIWLLSGALRTALYGVTPTDTATVASAVAMLLAAACLAIWMPSRRALRIDPSVALRAE